MDRNLGATTEDTPMSSNDINRSGGLHYQFGHKDPFVLFQRIYKSALGQNTQINKARARNIGESIKWPDQYFVVTDAPGTSWDWIEPNPYVNNLWNNPFPKEKEFKDKSFLDPCPEGWRLPLPGVWHSFSYDVINDKKKHRPRMASFNNGGNFYAGNDGGVTTFYPVAGAFTAYGNRTTLEAPGVYGAYWTALPYDRHYSFGMSMRNSYIIPQNSDMRRAMASSIRCVQE